MSKPEHVTDGKLLFLDNYRLESKKSDCAICNLKKMHTPREDFVPLLPLGCIIMHWFSNNLIHTDIYVEFI